MGGGWGHLMRVATYISTRKIEDFKIISANGLANQLFSSEQLIFIAPELETDPVAVAKELDRIIYELSPERFTVDVFPMGILGEFRFMNYLGDLPMDLISRYIKWPVYRAKTEDMGIRYDVGYSVETLHPEQDKWISDHANKIVELDIEYPVAKLTKSPFKEKKVWLVVHGADAREVMMLCELALDQAAKEKHKPAIYLLSDQVIDLPGVKELRNPVSADIYPFADMIFTAAGFNTMMETRPYRHKQVIQPFPRKYDDQFLRARNSMQKD